MLVSGAETPPCRLQYSVSIQVKSDAGGVGKYIMHLERSLVFSGFAKDWQPVLNMSAPKTLQAGAVDRATINMTDRIEGGIPQGYELTYRVVGKLVSGSSPVTLNEYAASNPASSVSLAIDFNFTALGSTEISFAAETGASVDTWTGEAVLSLSNASVSSTPDAWTGEVAFSLSSASLAASPQADHGTTDPLLIGPPPVSTPVPATLTDTFGSIDKTVIVIPAITGGYQPHWGKISVGLSVEAVGTSGGHAEFQLQENIADAGWVDVAGATAAWGQVVAGEEDQLDPEWTIDQTAGIADDVEIRYRLTGKTATTDYDVSVNANGIPSIRYLFDF